MGFLGGGFSGSLSLSDEFESLLELDDESLRIPTTGAPSYKWEKIPNSALGKIQFFMENVKFENSNTHILNSGEVGRSLNVRKVQRGRNIETAG